MAMEIERKFLVAGDGWRTQVVRSRGYRQGYFPGMETASVRLRVSGDKAHLNIKSATLGITRQEYDYGIPLRDAEEMLATLCGSAVIEKTRYWVKFGHLTWEIDVFEGENAGLVMAEVELESVDEEIPLPPWVGEEVSNDPRYYNPMLIGNPYRNWGNLS